MVLLQLQLGLVLVALAVLGYSVMFDFPVWVQWAYIASIVVGVAGLVAGLRELTRAYPRGYNFARMAKLMEQVNLQGQRDDSASNQEVNDNHGMAQNDSCATALAYFN